MGDPTTKKNPIIHMQSDFMRAIMNQEHLVGSLQSDTIEGVIYDLDHQEKQICIHFTSAFDSVLARWVPVLMSILFGRSSKDYYEHFKFLLNAFTAKNWQQFETSFPGITVDWSEAEQNGIVDAVTNHVRMKFAIEKFTKESAAEYLRKCDVHFKRSLQRVLQNESVVPAKKAKLFRKHIKVLISESTTKDTFLQSVKVLEKEFPKAMPSLDWHLNQRRARIFFQL